MKNISILSLLILLFMIISLSAQSGPVTASASALGNALTADAFGSSAVDLNPGGLGFIQFYDLEFSHLDQDFNYALDHLGAAFPFWKGGLGGSLLMFHPFLHKPEQIILDFATREKATLDYYTLNARSAFGLPLVRNFGVGVSFCFRQEHLIDQNFFDLALGAGVIYRMKVLEKILPWGSGPFKVEDDWDVSFGLHLKDILSLNSVEPAVLMAGAVARPFNFLKLLMDMKIEPGEGAGSFRTGLEFSWSVLSFDALGRAGYDITSKKFDLGAGLRLRTHSLYYQVDYAMNLADPGIVSSDLNGMNWISLTMGQNPLLMRTLNAYSFTIDEEVLVLKDEIVLKESDEIQLKEEEGRLYGIRIGQITTEDEYVRKKKYIPELRSFLKESLATAEYIVFSDNDADIELNGRFKREGELILLELRQRDTQNGSVLLENKFEKSITFDREFVQDYKSLNLIVKREGDRIVFVPPQTGVVQDKDLIKIRDMAGEIIRWVEDNIESTLSAEYIVQANFPGVEVYSDGRFMGITGPDQKYTLNLSRGEHELTFLLENSPGQKRIVTVQPGINENITIAMEQGVFYADLDISSWPEDITVFLDGTEKGQTPLLIENVKKGLHTVEYKPRGGKAWSETIEVKQEGTYRLYAVNKYSDQFKDLDEEFWSVIRQEDSMQISTKGKLLIAGEGDDAVWNANGIISRSFMPGNLKFAINVQGKGESRFFLAGITDSRGRGYCIGLDSETGQFYELGRERKKTVPALELRDSSGDQDLEISYHNDGTAHIILNGRELAEKTGKLEGKVRVFLFGDSTEAGADSEFAVRSLTLRNERN